MVRIELNDAEFREMNTDAGIIGAGVAKIAGQIRDEAKRIIISEDRSDTGALVQSIESIKIHSNTNEILYEVGSDLDYAIYQHEGIGPVVPRRAKVLRFKVEGTYVFTKRTSGFEGIKFLTRAMEQYSDGGV